MKTRSKIKMTSKMKRTSKSPNPPKRKPAQIQACMKTSCTMPDCTRLWTYSALRYFLILALTPPPPFGLFPQIMGFFFSEPSPYQFSFFQASRNKGILFLYSEMFVTGMHISKVGKEKYMNYCNVTHFSLTGCRFYFLSI